MGGDSQRRGGRRLSLLDQKCPFAPERAKDGLDDDSTLTRCGTTISAPTVSLQPFKSDDTLLSSHLSGLFAGKVFSFFFFWIHLTHSVALSVLIVIHQHDRHTASIIAKERSIDIPCAPTTSI